MTASLCAAGIMSGPVAVAASPHMPDTNARLSQSITSPHEVGYETGTNRPIPALRAESQSIDELLNGTKILVLDARTMHESYGKKGPSFDSVKKEFREAAQTQGYSAQQTEQIIARIDSSKGFHESFFNSSMKGGFYAMLVPGQGEKTGIFLGTDVDNPQAGLTNFKGYLSGITGISGIGENIPDGVARKLQRFFYNHEIAHLGDPLLEKQAQAFADKTPLQEAAPMLISLEKTADTRSAQTEVDTFRSLETVQVARDVRFVGMLHAPAFQYCTMYELDKIAAEAEGRSWQGFSQDRALVAYNGIVEKLPNIMNQHTEFKGRKPGDGFAVYPLVGGLEKGLEHGIFKGDEVKVAGDTVSAFYRLNNAYGESQPERKVSSDTARAHQQRPLQHTK
ncbi:MAG: hypothetical protein EOM37_08400 [Proteobacteria bacterium]|nr:hypothetical protein [Pseudomonadota bacterium]